MIYKINNISVMKDSGLDRVSASYNKYNDKGKTLAVNKRISRIVTDENVIAAIGVIEDYVNSIIEEV